MSSIRFSFSCLAALLSFALYYLIIHANFSMCINYIQNFSFELPSFGSKSNILHCCIDIDNYNTRFIQNDNRIALQFGNERRIFRNIVRGLSGCVCVVMMINVFKNMVTTEIASIICTLYFISVNSLKWSFD